MLSREEREELRQEMLEDARRDADIEHLMRTYDDFFLERTGFHEIQTLWNTFVQNCIHYDWDPTDFKHQL